MASTKEGQPSRRVSVFALARDLLNGGNTPENQLRALEMIRQKPRDPSTTIYRDNVLETALQDAMRKQGEVPDEQLISNKLETLGAK